MSAEGATLAEVIGAWRRPTRASARACWTTPGKLRRFVNVYVNDDDVRFEEGLETATPDGSAVSIIPAVAGG